MCPSACTYVLVREFVEVVLALPIGAPQFPHLPLPGTHLLPQGREVLLQLRLLRLQCLAGPLKRADFGFHICTGWPCVGLPPTCTCMCILWIVTQYFASTYTNVLGEYYHVRRLVCARRKHLLLNVTLSMAMHSWGLCVITTLLNLTTCSYIIYMVDPNIMVGV